MLANMMRMPTKSRPVITALPNTSIANDRG